MKNAQLSRGSIPRSTQGQREPRTKKARHVALALGRAVLLLGLPLVVFAVAIAQPAGVRASQDAARHSAVPHSGTSATLSVSPLSGPVGAHLSATGSKFKPNDPIEIGYSTTSSCASMTPIAGATGTSGGDGSLSMAMTWPQTSAGNYAVCALDTSTNHVTTGSNPFAVLSASAATLAISSPVKSSGQVTVTGSNFLPAGTSVEVFYGLNSTTSQSTGSANAPVCTQSAGTKTADSKGSFTITFAAPFVSVTTPMVVTAVAPQASCSGTPVLLATKTVNVLVATSASVTSTTTSSTNVFFNNNNSQIWPPSGVWSVVDCLVGLLLFLLLLLALLVASRNRSQRGSQNTQSTSAGQSAQGGNRLMGAAQVSMGQDGRPVASEQIYAQGRRGAPMHVASVEDTVEEEPMPQLAPSSSDLPPTPRYGPPQY